MVKKLTICGDAMPKVAIATNGVRKDGNISNVQAYNKINRMQPN